MQDDASDEASPALTTGAGDAHRALRRMIRAVRRAVYIHGKPARPAIDPARRCAAGTPVIHRNPSVGPMKHRSPQEKKQLSYLKDRRNTYGENDKSSRKNIPLSRAMRHRALRRVVRQALTDAPGDPAGLPEDHIELQMKRRPKMHGWRKEADTPLGTVLHRKLAQRKRFGIIDEPAAEEKARRIQQIVRGEW